MRAAVYVRVSTPEQRMLQQFRDLRAEAARRGWHIVRVYRERRSAGGVRPQWRRAMAGAAMREFDVLAVWALDRAGRSLLELVSAVERLEERGVRFVSLRDGAIDTTHASGALVLGVMASVAEFERRRLSERTKAGMEAARRRGAPIGRPRTRADAAIVQAVVRGELSAAEGARQVGVSERTMRRWRDRQKGAPAA